MGTGTFLIKYKYKRVEHSCYSRNFLVWALKLERLGIWDKQCDCILFMKVFVGGTERHCNIEVSSANSGIKTARSTTVPSPF